MECRAAQEEQMVGQDLYKKKKALSKKMASKVTRTTASARVLRRMLEQPHKSIHPKLRKLAGLPAEDVYSEVDATHMLQGVKIVKSEDNKNVRRLEIHGLAGNTKGPIHVTEELVKKLEAEAKLKLARRRLGSEHAFRKMRRRLTSKDTPIHEKRRLFMEFGEDMGPEDGAFNYYSDSSTPTPMTDADLGDRIEAMLKGGSGGTAPDTYDFTNYELTYEDIDDMEHWAHELEKEDRDLLNVAKTTFHAEEEWEMHELDVDPIHIAETFFDDTYCDAAYRLEMAEEIMGVNPYDPICQWIPLPAHTDWVADDGTSDQDSDGHPDYVELAECFQYMMPEFDEHVEEMVTEMANGAMPADSGFMDEISPDDSVMEDVHKVLDLVPDVCYDQCMSKLATDAGETPPDAVTHAPGTCGTGLTAGASSEINAGMVEDPMYAGSTLTTALPAISLCDWIWLHGDPVEKHASEYKIMSHVRRMQATRNAERRSLEAKSEESGSALEAAQGCVDIAGKQFCPEGQKPAAAKKPISRELKELNERLEDAGVNFLIPDPHRLGGSAPAGRRALSQSSGAAGSKKGSMASKARAAFSHEKQPASKFSNVFRNSKFRRGLSASLKKKLSL
jgi:hypothetical protein